MNSTASHTLADQTSGVVRPLLALAAVWILVHLLPTMRLEVWSQWEICQARKLLDYGFVERSGALLEPMFDTGRLAHPADLNYTHHPHPMVWLYTVLYAVGGPWLCVGYLLSLRLAGTLVFFLLLRRWFSVTSAWWAALFYATAPAAMTMALETNIIGIAAVYWPIAAWLAVRTSETQRGHWLLGIFVSLGGQTSWLFLPLMSALLWLAAPAGTRWMDLIRRPLALASSRAVLFGGFLSLGAFLFQLGWYTTSWPEVIHYLRAQMGMSRFTVIEETPKWKMAVLVPLRTAFYLGPALCFGVLAWLWRRRCEPARRLVESCLIFLAGYAVVGLALLRFCFVEVSPYLYLLFPMAVLTGAALEQAKSRLLLASLAISGALFFAYFTVRDLIPKRGRAVDPLVAAFSQETKAEDLIFTNLREYHPPFASWDTGAPDLVRNEADRLIFYGIQDAAGYEHWQRQLKRNFRNPIVVVQTDGALDPAFALWLRAHGELYDRRTLEVAPEPESLAIKIRLKVWQLSGRYRDRQDFADAATYRTTLEFYRVRP